MNKAKYQYMILVLDQDSINTLVSMLNCGLRQKCMGAGEIAGAREGSLEKMHLSWGVER